MRLHTRRTALALGLAAGLAHAHWALPAAAASLAVFGNSNATNDPNGFDELDLTAAVGTLSGMVNSAGASASGSGAASAQASASATYGRLATQASGITFGPFPESGGGAAGSGLTASWTDVFTIHATNPAQVNQPGTFVFQIQLTGNLQVDSGGADSSNTRASYGVDVFSDFCGAGCTTQRFGQLNDFGSQGGGVFFEGEPIGTFTGTPAFFIFGMPVDLTVRLNASTQTVAGAQAFTSTASADLGSTLDWGGFLEVRDSEGNLVTAYSVTSESGVDWSQPVPEPATALFVATGLLGLGAAGRRKIRG